MERADAIQAGDDSVTSSVIQGKFGCGSADGAERLDSAHRSPQELTDLSVPDDVRRALFRSRVFGSICIAGTPGVTIHRGILNLVSNNLAGRNPMASIDGESLRVRFALNSGDPDNEHLVREFAEGVAGLMGSAAVTRARVLSFDTSDIDHLLSPEFRSE